MWQNYPSYHDVVGTWNNGVGMVQNITGKQCKVNIFLETRSFSCSQSHGESE